jgi:SAM-dependent methyltransferase
LKNFALLINPQANGAYFKDTLLVASAEFQAVFGEQTLEHRVIGNLQFLVASLDESLLTQVLRLSFVLGVFEIDGDQFIPIDVASKYNLHEDFVFGSKYRGKTNEHLTQLLLNVGLSYLPKGTEQPTLLDPMCGRGTTMLWAMRYGLSAKGIEQDVKAIEDLRQGLKKWTKLHRQRHKMMEGFIGKANKKGLGKFLEFTVEEQNFRIINGDSREAATLIKSEKFDLIISDLPYGVQHFTTDKTRNPISVLAECIADWKKLLKKDGVIVLAFNSYIPKRTDLIECFENNGLIAQSFTAPHRMSESIVRDIIVFKHA